MERLELYGHITDTGQFVLNNRQRFIEWANKYPGKDVAVRFERKSSKRSDPANRYYWGCCVREVTIRLRELGHDWMTDESCHEFLKLKFNCEQVIGEGGEVMELPKSTASLTKSQFAEYVDRIRMWAADFLCINILDPNTQAQMIFND